MMIPNGILYTFRPHKNVRQNFKNLLVKMIDHLKGVTKLVEEFNPGIQ